MDEKVFESVEILAEEYAKTRSENGDSDGNAVYALIDQDGRSKTRLKINRISYHTCFGRLNTLSYNNTNIGTPEALLIQMQKNLYGDKKEFDKEFQLYYEWLFNFSPFRDAFITKDAAKVIDRGVIVVDTNIDSRIMIGAAISTRHPWENFGGYRAQMKPIMALWKKMVESGMNPNYAFVVAFGLRHDGDGNWMVTAGGFGHQALKYGPSYLHLHSNFANDRKRNDKVETYRDYKRYKSPSDLFGLEVKSEHGDFHSWLTKHMKKAATGSSKIVNPFGSPPSAYISEAKIIPHFMDLQSEFVKAA